MSITILVVCNDLLISCLYPHHEKLNFCDDYDSFAHTFAGSCADMLKSSFPQGMNEILIAAILWEILQGLDYLHKMGIIHRYIVMHSLSIIKERLAEAEPANTNK